MKAVRGPAGARRAPGPAKVGSAAALNVAVVGLNAAL
jgi:hypothetical protein